MTTIPAQPDPIFVQPGGEEITLENAPGVEFEQFVYANALLVERVMKQDEAKGQHIVICGAGPSLADHAHEYCPAADQVWGCNSALPWLAENGHKVTHGFTVDQTPEMLRGVPAGLDRPPAPDRIPPGQRQTDGAFPQLRRH